LRIAIEVAQGLAYLLDEDFDLFILWVCPTVLVNTFVF
jgi:hypothetical protein